MAYIWCNWQGIHKIYGHIRCIFHSVATLMSSFQISGKRCEEEPNDFFRKDDF